MIAITAAFGLILTVTYGMWRAVIEMDEAHYPWDEDEAMYPEEESECE